MLDKIFNDTEQVLYLKFSTMIIFTFIYYILFYYSIMPSSFTKPALTTVLLLIASHLIHISIVRYLYQTKKYLYAWLLILLPVILYQIYSKYSSYRFTKDMEMKALYMAHAKAEVQAEQQSQVGPRPDIVMRAPTNKHLNYGNDSTMPRQMMPEVVGPMGQYGQQQMGMDTNTMMNSGSGVGYGSGFTGMSNVMPQYNNNDMQNIDPYDSAFQMM